MGNAKNTGQIQIKSLLRKEKAIKKMAEKYQNASDFLYLGRGLNFPVALEGALKLKEISYIHAEGYPAAEMKHGPIALLSDGSPVIAVVPSDSKLNLMESSIRECKTRGAKIILITDNEGPLTELADILIQTPLLAYQMTQSMMEGRTFFFLYLMEWNLIVQCISDILAKGI